MRSRVLRVGVFLGLALVFPCPWYMLAIGGVLPLPVILLFGSGIVMQLSRSHMGVGGSVVLLITLVHLVIYAWVFHRISAWVGSLVRTGRVPASVAVPVVLAILVALTFAPIYGSGENLGGGGVLKDNAYEVYRDALGAVFSRRPPVAPSPMTRAVGNRAGAPRRGREAETTRAREDGARRAGLPPPARA
jgi:hypothetical protein